MSEIKPLTSLRFLAAFYVLIFHCLIRWDIPLLPKFFTNVLMMAPMAMSLFFILSGFILTYNYFDINLKTGYANFLLRRFARIYPIYLCAALLTAPLITLPINPAYNPIFEHHNAHLLELLFHGVQAIFLLFTNVFLLQAWIPALFNYWNDGGSWSLSVEAFFYLLFPMIIFVLYPLRKKVLDIVLIVAFIFSLLPGIGFLFFTPHPIVSTIYILPIFRLPEFIIGVVLGIYFKKNLRTVKTPMLNILVVVVIWILYAGIMGDKIPGYVTNDFIIIPICALLIWNFSQLKKGYFYRLVTHKAIIILGEASYALYLLQAIPILYLERYRLVVSKYFPWFLNNYFMCIFVIAASLVLSIIFYVYIEKPCRIRLINKYSGEMLPVVAPV